MEVAAGLGPAGVVNALKVTTPQQVMLKVRFVEATRAAARSLGVRWEFFRRGATAGVVGNQAGSSKFSVASPEFALGSASGVASGTSNSVADAVSGLTSGASPFATILTQIVNNSSGKLDVVLSALEERIVLRTLAEPNLIAMSGETADFLAGGEYPVPVVSAASAGALPTITIIYKEFGVKLSFTPTVLARGVISLKLMPEVSELDFTNAVTVAGTTIPALTVRRARTTVELRDGQSFGIAGLLQATSTRDQNQVPWLGSVPVIGALFRSAAYQANETELVVLVTPYLIKPVPPDKAEDALGNLACGERFRLFPERPAGSAKNTADGPQSIHRVAKPVWRHRAGPSGARTVGRSRACSGGRSGGPSHAGAGAGAGGHSGPCSGCCSRACSGARSRARAGSRRRWGFAL